MEKEIWGAEDRLVKLVITGAESSGKTTLAKTLADHFQCFWVPEYARDYLEINGAQYQFDDLLKIAGGQKSMQEILEQKSRIADQKLLISDTDLLTIKIWSQVRFEKVDPQINHWLEESSVDLYLLCKPDIPWKKDPLRENENDREHLFSLYEKELKEKASPYAVIGGDRESRKAEAITKVEALLSSLFS